jgi:hypothetical protein
MDHAKQRLLKKAVLEDKYFWYYFIYITYIIYIYGIYKLEKVFHFIYNYYFDVI